jgi:DNA-binding transcriptional LysR family regulator
VDAHLLRTFVTVARLGSFSAAAAELAYTQAAVSQQVAALESDLKVTLLRRRPVEPTEAGTRLLEHAIPILLRLDAARADVTRMTAPPAARLIVAMTPLAAATGAAVARLAELRARLPRLDLTVRVASRQDVAEATARGEADLGLTDGLSAPSDPLPLLAPLSAARVAESAVCVVLPAGHPLARPPRQPGGTDPPTAGLRLADLADAGWIDAPGVGPALDDLRRASGAEGFRVACRYEGSDALALLRMAAAGHGLTLLPTALLSTALLSTALPPAALPPTAVLSAVPAQADVLAAPGHIAAIPVSEPRLVHRVELVHGTLPAGSPAAALAALLR